MFDSSRKTNDEPALKKRRDATIGFRFSGACRSARTMQPNQIDSVWNGKSRLNPQAEYMNSLRVDSALERCIQMISAQLAQRFRRSVSAVMMSGMGTYGQMEQLRQCMLREFAGKIPPHHWNMLENTE
ncbi:unnamed protein product [Echinostoma caproni]|uniref:Acyl-CoA_dh_1 domain-containing protein n=1 Tax=Echinostoma caproni TaxID=27848 RepID=A0A183ASG5_9TREM|nr:unnamed protein product [Echinostoma caproni]